MTADRITFDLTAEDLDTSFKLTPEGWYKVEIDDVEDDRQSSAGNDQLLVKYKSIDESFKGTIWDFVTITKASINNVVNLSRAAGLPVPTKEKPGQFVVPTADDLIGKELQIEVIHVDDYKKAEDDEGNIIKRAQVKFAGRKTINEKVGKTPAKGTTAKGKASAASDSGFTL